MEKEASRVMTPVDVGSTPLQSPDVDVVSTHYREGERRLPPNFASLHHSTGTCISPALKGPGRKRGRLKKPVRKEQKILSYTSKDDVTYNVGDAAFIETNRPDMPYCICSIHGFKLSKRDTLFVQVKWYYRSSEVPDTVYQHLVQDRHFENNSGLDLVIKNPRVKVRELFCSDTVDSVRASLLRGHCTVIHYKDIFAAKDFKPLPNTFFYVLGYNPETKRLATTQGEIRIGPSHQARLPECTTGVSGRDVPDPPRKIESITWRPSKIADGDLMMFLRAARSMAAFAGMCDGGTPEDGCHAASMDETTMNAMITLHDNSYDTGKALQSLVKCPVPRSIEKKWNSEETKRFAKGLRQYGKNFFKIRRELLSHKETSELVEYYYYWKKTPAAAGSRPHRKGRRSVLRRQPRPSRPTSSEFLESSNSEASSNESAEDSDTKDLPVYTCQKCFTTVSKEWHHVGRDRIIVCSKCKVFFKKYGDDQSIDEADLAPFLFKPVNDEDASNESCNMRTRRIKEEISKDASDEHLSNSESEDIPLSVMSGRKSPSALSTCSNSSVEKKQRSKSPCESRKRPCEEDPSDSKDIAIKKERVESPVESSNESSSLSSKDDDNGNEGDVENNQDDNSSGSYSVPSPTPDHSDFKTTIDIKSERESPPPEPIQEPLSPCKSPERETESPELHVPRSPSPPPKIVDQEVYKSKNAIFIKHWSRGENSCCRCDWTFRPVPGSRLAKKREERTKRIASPPIVIKEEKKPVRTPENTSADAQITSSFSSTHYADRHTPRAAAYPDTPALRQLGEFARPHALAHDMPRSIPHMSAASPGIMDPILPYSRIPGLYHPGARERLEYELERDKRERDAREREMRERELREMEMREKMKEIEMKQHGMERMPSLAGIDPQWLELQRRYGIPPGTPGMIPPHAASHLPGVYPPNNLQNDLLARERERLERLGIPTGPPHPGESAYSNSVERLSAERLHAERMALAGDPVARLQLSAGLIPSAHSHAHTHAHTHLHLHQPGMSEQMPPPPTSTAFGPPFLPPFLQGADPLAAAMAANAAASSPGHPFFGPHGYPPHMLAGREREMPPELLARYADPAVQQQLSAQAAHHEAIQRQLAIERQLGHLPH